jgi:two-component system, NtrC family, sensor kinase
MKVLIADDDPVSRRLLQSYLQKWGHEVIATVNGAEAWRQIQTEGFPLVVSDWMMPEMDGLQLVKHIRTHPRPGYTYIILVTERSQKEDIVTGIEAGADDFVTKPFDRDELHARLRTGERIVALERRLAEQNEALRQAHAELERKS